MVITRSAVLLSAVVAMVVGLAVIGGWLLPQVGLQGPLARGIGAALGGVVISVLYFRMIKGADGA